MRVFLLVSSKFRLSWNSEVFIKELYHPIASLTSLVIISLFSPPSSPNKQNLIVSVAIHEEEGSQGYMIWQANRKTILLLVQAVHTLC